MTFPDGTLTLLVCLLLATTVMGSFAALSYACWAHGQLDARDAIIAEQAARLRTQTGRILSTSGRFAGRPPARHMAPAEQAEPRVVEGRRTPVGTRDAFTVRAPARTRVVPVRQLKPLNVRELKADADWRNGPARRIGPPTPPAGTRPIRIAPAA